MSNDEKMAGYLQVLDLPYIIGAPLIATAEADFHAATKFIEFIRSYCFQQQGQSGESQPAAKDDENLGRLRMLTFYYERPVIYTAPIPEIRRESRIISIPLISLLPLPLLQVKDAEFQFDVLILGGRAVQPPPPLLSEEQASQPSKKSLPSNPFRFAAKLARSIPSRDGQGPFSSTGNLKVRINLQQADVPAGLATLLSSVTDASHGSDGQKS
jgi:hypothetical protein